VLFKIIDEAYVLREVLDPPTQEVSIPSLGLWKGISRAEIKARAKLTFSRICM